jgi:hypothetical protein
MTPTFHVLQGARDRAGRPARGDTSNLRRIWEVDPSRVAMVAGVLLGRDEAVALLASPGWCADAGDDVVWTLVARARCRDGALAEAVEEALHRRSEPFAPLVDGKPMISIADWWSRARGDLSGGEVAALLWRLTCDPRPVLEKLAGRVAGDLCGRALQLVRDHGRCATAHTGTPRHVDAVLQERAAV